MIINLRGINGSGKSTVARSLLSGPFETTKQVNMGVTLVRYTDEKEKYREISGYYNPDLDLIVVGTYTTDCGGCDGIKTQALIKQAVLSAALVAKHVLFEGIIVSTLFGGYDELNNKLVADGHPPMVWAYLDTPYEVCLERIYKRNGGKKIKEEIVYKKIKMLSSTRRKAEAAGLDVRTVPYMTAVEEIKSWLK